MSIPSVKTHGYELCSLLIHCSTLLTARPQSNALFCSSHSVPSRTSAGTLEAGSFLRQKLMKLEASLVY